jgi:hypothetical protein
VYATGDLGRLLPDGNIEILGRDDFQVKINGYRVELGEIESTLGRHPAVESAVVVAPASAGGGRRLTAFVVPSGELEVADLTSFLSERLPSYLVPADIRLLDELPLTRNVKVDRLALTALAERHEVDAVDNAEATPLEQVVAEFYALVLELEEVGLDSNFFQFGGDSLRGTRLAGQLTEVLGVDVGLRAVLTRTTPRELSAAIVAEPDTGPLATAMAVALMELSDGVLADSDAA